MSIRTDNLTQEVFEQSNSFQYLYHASSIGKALMEALDDFVTDGTITGAMAAQMLQNFDNEIEAQSRDGWNRDAFAAESRRASPSDPDRNSHENSSTPETSTISATNRMASTPAFHLARRRKVASPFSVTFYGKRQDCRFDGMKQVHVMHLSDVHIELIGRSGEYLEEFAPRLAIFAKEDVEAAPAEKKRKRVAKPDKASGSKRTKV
ncbi:transcription initiation from RNA polymerase II promoter [Rhizina undulata]